MILPPSASILLWGRLSAMLSRLGWSAYVHIGVEPVGRWGLALLAVAGLAGLGLGVHGWSARHVGTAPAALNSPAPAASSGRPSNSAGPSPSATPSGTQGPLLSSMPYASQAYLIYPGAVSAAARQALTGLTVTIRRHGAIVSLTTAVNGGPTSAPRTFPASSRVYIVETALGDDSGASDYNLGDDGLVVTDAKGRIVQ